MNALIAAGQNTILSIKHIGELMGDPEQRDDGSRGGPCADQLLQYAREGKLRTVTNGHILFGYSALVHVTELAACMAATGIGQKTPAAGWVRLKGTRKTAQKITDDARRHIAAQAQLGVTVTNIQAVQFVAGNDA